MHEFHQNHSRRGIYVEEFMFKVVQVEPLLVHGALSEVYAFTEATNTVNI